MTFDSERDSIESAVAKYERFINYGRCVAKRSDLQQITLRWLLENPVEISATMIDSQLYENLDEVKEDRGSIIWLLRDLYVRGNEPVILYWWYTSQINNLRTLSWQMTFATQNAFSWNWVNV